MGCWWTTRHSVTFFLSIAMGEPSNQSGNPTCLVCCRVFCRVLNAELEAVLLSKAAQLGLPADWVSLLDELDPERRQVSALGMLIYLGPCCG